MQNVTSANKNQLSILFNIKPFMNMAHSGRQCQNEKKLEIIANISAFGNEEREREGECQL